MHPRILCATLFLLGILTPVKVRSQICPPLGCPQAAMEAPRLKGHVVSLGVNTVIGGLTGGIGSNARGGSFWRGFALGAGGGAVVYAGKRISGDGFRGSGLVGRQASAVGTSIVANAAAKRGGFDRIVLPIGITRLYLNRGQGESSRLKVDLPATVAALYYAVHSHARLDVNRSVSAGALVFVQGTGELHRGTEVLGVIRLSEDTRERMARSQSHEQIHVAQTDFTFLAWSEPAERLLFSKTAPTRWLHRYFDFRLDGLVLSGLNEIIDHPERPWEKEAFFLSRTKMPRREPVLLGSRGY